MEQLQLHSNMFKKKIQSKESTNTGKSQKISFYKLLHVMCYQIYRDRVHILSCTF